MRTLLAWTLLALPLWAAPVTPSAPVREDCGHLISLWSHFSELRYPGVAFRADYASNLHSLLMEQAGLTKVEATELVDYGRWLSEGLKDHFHMGTRLGSPLDSQRVVLCLASPCTVEPVRSAHAVVSTPFEIEPFSGRTDAEYHAGFIVSGGPQDGSTARRPPEGPNLVFLSMPPADRGDRGDWMEELILELSSQSITDKVGEWLEASVAVEAVKAQGVGLALIPQSPDQEIGRDPFALYRDFVKHENGRTLVDEGLIRFLNDSTRYLLSYWLLSLKTGGSQHPVAVAALEQTQERLRAMAWRHFERYPLLMNHLKRRLTVREADILYLGVGLLSDMGYVIQARDSLERMGLVSPR